MNTITVKSFSSTKEMMAFLANENEMSALRKEVKEKYGNTSGSVNLEELTIEIKTK